MSIQKLISERFQGVLNNQLKAADLFHKILIEGNKDQNLTRLLNDEDFVEGHFRDCWELLTEFKAELGESVMDLGSGCGVPGLLVAALESERQRSWLLVDSERQKTDFLKAAIEKMDLATTVKATWGRGELVLKDCDSVSIVSRAVGPVSRVYGWIKDCSTWNSLFLFKGKSWDDEWAALPERDKKRLKIAKKHEYQTHSGIYRVIIHLEHVPRGTKNL